MAVLMPISAVAKGEYIRLRENGPVWIRGPYDRSTRKYTLSAWSDWGKFIERRGDVLVWVGFTF